MNIPLQVVQKGQHSVQKYIEINNEIDDIEKKYRPLEEEYEELLHNTHDLTNYDPRPKKNNYHYIGLPYIRRYDSRQTDLVTMSRVTDALWTTQNRMHDVVMEMAGMVHRYTELHEQLDEILS